MCKMKIHLFETSPKYGFAATGADRRGPQENNFLRGSDCSLGAQVPVTSEFESYHGGMSDSNLDMQRGDSAAPSRDIWLTICLIQE